MIPLLDLITKTAIAIPTKIKGFQHRVSNSKVGSAKWMPDNADFYFSLDLNMLHYWWQAARPKTLPASVGPILLGTALASTVTDISWVVFLVTLICAMSLQIAVNLANDLFDGLSGVDDDNRLGPPRMVQSGHISPDQMKLGLGLCTSVAVASGLVLVSFAGWELFLIGTGCVLGVFAYSAGPVPLASCGLGEATVLVFFGWVAVIGSYYLQTENVSLIAFLFGTASGLFSAAMMLVNNLRDLTTDEAAGKVTLAVRLGETLTRGLYIVMIFTALVFHMLAANTSAWHMLIPLAVCAAPMLKLISAIRSQAGQALNGVLANTAKLGLIYCISTSAVLMTL
tara:strand:- start:202 stop:1221 length:1020 start_codon:yes stop_codon:yes gene_type:complete